MYAQELCYSGGAQRRISTAAPEMAAERDMPLAYRRAEEPYIKTGIAGLLDSGLENWRDLTWGHMS